jgi:FtsX-like permease family
MRKLQRRTKRTTKSVLRLPDLEHAKNAVLNSLTSSDAQRGYRHAIDDDWYCSEPRLAFNRIVVLRYRSHLESRQLAPGTVNLRLGAVRRLAYEAADCGLLSADLAAGIRRVKGVKKLGVRLGNWQLEPARSMFEIMPLGQRLDDAFAENRLRTLLLTFFAATAVSLASIGLYGTLSYSVTVRQREIGLRLALGALQRQILRQFLLQGVRVTFIGCIVGWGLAVAFTRVLSGMLFGVSPSDAATLSPAVILMLVVATLAAVVPALRAAHVDPMDVLREK